jgi:hypothetical protein
MMLRFSGRREKAPLLSFNARSLRSFLKMKERGARWREKSITRALPDARSPRVQANYINALAVSVLPFFEPAEVTLGGSIFFSLVDFL